MLTIQGRSSAACDGISRRRLLQAGGAGLFGVSLPRLLAAESSGGIASSARAKSVIFLFLYGGPGQLETFDMKPDAPAKIRGPFQPIASRTPGLRICEHLPRTAAVSDRFCVVRTMTHPYNDHSTAGHYLQTGHPWQIPIGGGFVFTPKDWPSMGSIVEYQARRTAAGKTQSLPGYVVLPNCLGRLQEAGMYLRPGEYAGWLGRGYDPLTTAIDKRDMKDNPYWRDCTDDELRFEIQGLVNPREMTLNRLNRRNSLLAQFDSERWSVERHAAVRGYEEFQQRALALVSSEQTRAALDIRREPAALRDRYGRHLFGQSTLMARRLVEAGVRFVTVHYDCVDGYSWDAHVNTGDMQKHLLPTFDQAYSALLTDLDERGLLKETLVIALGEMGRTPTAANGAWGRGHWSTLFPAVIAGAGVRGGAVYGTSDKDAAYVVEKPVRPEDLAATIFHSLGIDPDARVPDPQGRPTAVAEGGTLLTDLFG